MSQQTRVRLTKKAAKKTTHKRISPTPQPIEADAYYDAPQLAARYGLHEVTLWKWAREGKIPKPVKMAHITITESHNVLVKVTTDEGIIGWGEGVAAGSAGRTAAGYQENEERRLHGPRASGPPPGL